MLPTEFQTAELFGGQDTPEERFGLRLTLAKFACFSDDAIPHGPSPGRFGVRPLPGGEVVIASFFGGSKVRVAIRCW